MGIGGTSRFLFCLKVVTALRNRFDDVRKKLFSHFFFFSLIDEDVEYAGGRSIRFSGEGGSFLDGVDGRLSSDGVSFV